MEEVFSTHEGLRRENPVLVFQCYLSERAMAQLRWELAKILSKEDSLLIAPIYAPDQNKIIQWNMSAEWSPDRERFKTL